MHSSIKHHARQHRLFYIISVILLIFIVVAGYANYRTMIAARKSFYTTTLERQSLSELNLYHESSSALAGQYFRGAIDAITNLASDQTMQQQLVSNSSAALITTLGQQRMISSKFDSLTILTANGTIAGYSSNKGNSPIGSDASKTASFMSGKDASGTILLSAHASPINRIIVSVASPIRDKNNKLLGVAVGGLTLQTVAEQIKLNSQYNTDLTSLLTDSDGNVLVWQDKPANGLINLKDKEPGLAALMRQQALPSTQEYNFEQKDSLAQGSVIDFKNTGKLYLVSFYNRGGYEKRLKDAVQDINVTFSSFVVRNSLLFLSAMLLIGIIIRVHEKRAS